MKSLIVDKKYDNVKLNKFLLDTFPALKLNTIYKALRKKDILVNGKRISENIVLSKDDKVTIYISDEFLTKLQEFNLDIVYEDDNIILINKPSGISINETAHNEANLNELLKMTYNNLGKYPLPCHRLDRNTTGLVLYAKNKESLDVLLDKFKSREIEKQYVCIVNGIPEKQSDTLRAYLFKDSKKSLVYIYDKPQKGCLDICTSYYVLEKNEEKNISLLSINLETGRTHQIRAHLAHIGHPIIGDR